MRTAHCVLRTLGAARRADRERERAPGRHELWARGAELEKPSGSQAKGAQRQDWGTRVHTGGAVIHTITGRPHPTVCAAPSPKSVTGHGPDVSQRHGGFTPKRQKKLAR